MLKQSVLEKLVRKLIFSIWACQFDWDLDLSLDLDLTLARVLVLMVRGRLLDQR